MIDSSRNRSGLGSKREVAPGVWDVAVSVGYKSDGFSQRRTYARVLGTARDADRKIAELSADMGRFAHLGDGTTLDEYWDMIYHPRCLSRVGMRDSRTRKRKMAKTTLKRYESLWKLHIQPQFGDWDMSQIRHAPVQAWAYTMTRGTAEHAVRLLRAMLRSAWAEDDLLDQQPLPKPIDLPGDEAEQARIWMPDELMRALPYLRGTNVETAALVMAGGGLRKEEMAALWWHDMEFVLVDALHHREDGTPVHSRDWVCYVPVDDAVTLDDGRKDVKTRRGRRVAVIGEPFSSRLLALMPDTDGPVLQVGLRKLPYSWKRLWDEAPLKYKGGKGRYVRGRMLVSAGDGSGKRVPVVPFVELRTLRHTHECMMAQHLSDSENSLLHGHSREISYAHYRRENVEAATRAAQALAGELLGRAI